MRKRKYKPETIIHIVKANLESGIAIYRLSEQYGIHRGRIQEWIEQYKINGESAFFTKNTTEYIVKKQNAKQLRSI